MSSPISTATRGAGEFFAVSMACCRTFNTAKTCSAATLPACFASWGSESA